MTPKHPEDPKAVLLPLATSDEAVWVDPETLVKYGHLKWRLNSSGYPVACINGRDVPLHRLVCRAPNDLDVDHINRNRCDARRANLRPATRSQNNVNRIIAKKSSLPRGVKKIAGTYADTYYAEVGKGQYRWGASFRTEAEAALAYDKMAYKLYGEFAVLNYPLEYVLSQPVPKPLTHYNRAPTGAVPYLGVHKQGNKYCGQCYHLGKRYRTSVYDTPQEAAIARDQLIDEHSLPHRRNFPEGCAIEAAAAYLELAGD